MTRLIEWIDKYDFGLMWAGDAVGLAMFAALAVLTAAIEGFRGIAAWIDRR